MPLLMLISPAFSGQSCELPDGTFTVGRGWDNDIVIRDYSVSKEHCELLVYGPEVIVRERGSRNGTFVDGVRVEAQRGVKHGECIRFGKIEARLDNEQIDYAPTTSISAMHAFQSLIQQSNASQPPQTTFPVVFESNEKKE